MRKQNVRPWLCLAGAFMMLFISSGLGTNGISLFYVPVTKALGFSQTEFAIYYSITSYVAAFLCPVMGKLFTARIHLMKKVMVFAGALTFLCFAAYSRCSTLPQFYIVSVFRGIANSALSYVSATMVVNNWFCEKRGLAMSIAMMGTSAGGFIFTQLSRIFLESFGWRWAYLLLGCVSLIVNAVMLIFVRPEPSAIGLTPYGAAVQESSAATEAPKTGLTLSAAMKTPYFWLILVSFFCTGITVQGTQQAVTTALQLDYGHSQAFASAIMSIIMVGLCFGKLIVGRISDKKGFKVTVLYCVTLLVIAFACLLFGKSPIFAVAFGVFFGFGNMFGTLIPSLTATNVFGMKEYGAIFGFVSMCSTLGNATGPTLSSFIFDSTGSYTAVWIIYAALNILAVVSIITCFNKMNKKLAVAG